MTSDRLEFMFDRRMKYGLETFESALIEQFENRLFGLTNEAPLSLVRVRVRDRG
jgi:hypothetical protein